jgi:hypothetical protein
VIRIVPPERRDIAAAAAGCSVALFLALAWPMFSGRTFLFDDLGTFHLPVRHLYAEALRGGDSILWTPSLFSGFYLHGEGQAGMLHPLHLLLYGTLPLQVAFHLEFLSSYVLAFAGMWIFLRRLQLSTETALAGGMLFAFGGFQLLHFHHMNVIAVVAHLPWLLAGIDALFTSSARRSLSFAYAGIALTIASAVLLGFPQAVWWDVLGAGAFTLYRAFETRRFIRLVAAASAGATGVLLGAIQLLPTLDVAAHSTRAGIASAFALTYSLHPYNLIQLWSPSAIRGTVYSWADPPSVHEFGVYCGTLAMLAPLWLWIRRDGLDRSRRTLAAAAAAFAIVLLVLAFGRYGLVDVLLTRVPGLGSLRAPARYIVLVQFALAALSVLALEDLSRRAPDAERVSRRGLLLLSAPLILSLATTALFNGHLLSFAPRRLVPASMATAAVGTAIVAFVTAAFLAAVRSSRAIPVLVVAAAIDLGWWGLGYVWATRPRPLVALTRMTPAAIPGYRYDWADEWRNRPVLLGHRLAWGYAGLFPATSAPPDGAAFLQLAGAAARVRADGPVVPLPGAVGRARVAAGD